MTSLPVSENSMMEAARSASKRPSAVLERTPLMRGGNQARLRRTPFGAYAGMPPMRPSRSIVLQRQSACGAAGGMCGCAQCRRTHTSGSGSGGVCQRVAFDSAHSNRCASDDEACTVDEPVTYRGGHGLASCDTSRGIVQEQVKEHCAGNCVAVHEHTHALDYGDCCERYGRCYQKSDSDPVHRQCDDAWNTYIDRIRDWTECNAFNAEGQCLTALIKENCNRSGGPISDDCCTELQTEMDFVTKKIGEHCPNATQWFCAFQEDGTIIKI